MSQRRITIITVRKGLQERALVALDLLSFLGHLAFTFHGTLDERGDPSLTISSCFFDVSPKGSKSGQSPPRILLFNKTCWIFMNAFVKLSNPSTL